MTKAKTSEEKPCSWVFAGLATIYCKVHDHMRAFETTRLAYLTGDILRKGSTRPIRMRREEVDQHA